MSIELWTLAIAVVTSLACALCGSLLLVNRQAMMSEGLSHAVFPGLVLAFLLIRDYSSPLLIFSAAASGLIMVWLTQWLSSTRLVDADAGLGIVFAGMFSVGVLLVSLKLRNTHFHADCIIDGNLALAPLDRLEIAGVDLGPRAWIGMLSMLLICVTFISVCYKELKLMLFEPLLARRFGLRPAFLQFLWLAIVSLTTVAAFRVAGTILIVALMIAPPAAAYLLSDRLSGVLLVAATISVISSVIGFYWSMWLDISPAGPIASTAGIVFLMVFAFAPKRGVIGVWIRRRRQRREVLDALVLEGISRLSSDSVQDYAVGLGLPTQRVTRAVQRLQARKLIRPAGHFYQVTPDGRSHLATVHLT